MRLTNKILIGILVAAITLISIILVLAIFIMVSFNNEISNYKQENYFKEDDLTEIAYNRDWYLYKINNEYFISVNYGENFEIKKVNSKYIDNYSDLDNYSDVIFEGKNPLKSYYLIKDNNLYIKNNEIKKCINLSTEQISDFDKQIKGNWDTFQ